MRQTIGSGLNLLNRDEFRLQCLERDNHRCVVCHNGNELAVHHIVERRLWADGGLIDYDGIGCFAMQRRDAVWLCNKVHILPSDITKLGITPPKWATAVVWYNR